MEPKKIVKLIDNLIDEKINFEIWYHTTRGHGAPIHETFYKDRYQRIQYHQNELEKYLTQEFQK